MKKRNRLLLIATLALSGFGIAQSNLQAVAQHQVSLTWTNGSGASTVNIYRYNDQSCPANVSTTTATKIDSSTTLISTYTDIAVLPNMTYCYFVTDVNSNGESAPSNAVNATIPPSPPFLASLIANAVSGTVISNWLPALDGSNANATYNIYRSAWTNCATSTTFKVQNAGGPLTQLAYQNANQIVDPYCYYATAVVNGLESAPSNKADIQIQSGISMQTWVGAR